MEGFYSSASSKHATISFGGEQLRLLQFQVINEVMIKDRLIDKVDLVGASMRKAIENVVSKKPALSGVRGLGTSLFIDTLEAE